MSRARFFTLTCPVTVPSAFSTAAKENVLSSPPLMRFPWPPANELVAPVATDASNPGERHCADEQRPHYSSPPSHLLHPLVGHGLPECRAYREGSLLTCGSGVKRRVYGTSRRTGSRAFQLAHQARQRRADPLGSMTRLATAPADGGAGGPARSPRTLNPGRGG